MTRSEAGPKLKKIVYLDRFHDEQWIAIDKLLASERILLIEKTGFGKPATSSLP
jgi:superfamily II DNA helicase RecQ